MTALYLFFKAFQPGLFDQQVQVSGHVTKRGTVVAPYHSTRKKRPEPPPGEDLFAQADRKAMETEQKKAREEAEKAEREAAERKFQPRSAPDPTANRAAMKENEIKRPMEFFHGTAAKSKITRFKPGITFLSPDPENARQFAENPILSGSSDGHKGGGKPRVIQVTVHSGKIKDISAEVDDAIFNDEDPDQVIAEEAKKALANGFEYVKFMHPGHNGEDFFALVSAKPETLKVTDRKHATATKSYLFMKAAA